MSDGPIKTLILYKLAMAIALLFTLNAVAISIVSALSGVDHWDQLTRTQQIVIVCSILANCTNTLLAFANRSLSRVQEGKFPIGGEGDTARYTRTTTVETAETQPPKKD